MIERKKKIKRHGLSKTRLYRIWNGMKQRCYRKKGFDWKRYGGKGIKVCKKWHNFINFYDWAIANGYAENLTIDRINSNGNYEPKNCQWVTRAENSHRAGIYISNKKILCIETGNIYNTMVEASVAVGLKNSSTISEALMLRRKFGKVKKTAGYTWDVV